MFKRILWGCFAVLAISSTARAAPNDGIGSSLHRVLWTLSATDYLRDHPDAFQRLATKYLGLSNQPLSTPPQSTARMIPGYEPIAAALLRLRMLPLDASPESKRRALSSFDDGIVRLAQDLYSARAVGLASQSRDRLTGEELTLHPAGLPSTNASVKTLLDSLPEVDGLKPLAQAFGALSDTQANDIIDHSVKLTMPSLTSRSWQSCERSSTN
jgi:hypothetical protein